MDPFQDYCFSGFLGYIIFFLFLGHIKIAEGAVQSGLYLTGMTSVLWVSCCRAQLLSTQCCNQMWLFRAGFQMQLIPGTSEEKWAVQRWQQDGYYYVLATGSLSFGLGK